ncbi:MAG: hypothetical protein AB7O57_02940 [Hyphomicrobiaceae bacterium]
MSSSPAVDAVHAGDWGVSPVAAADKGRHALPGDVRKLEALSDDDATIGVWRSRRLKSALAELGPAVPVTLVRGPTFEPEAMSMPPPRPAPDSVTRPIGEAEGAHGDNVTSPEAGSSTLPASLLTDAMGIAPLPPPAKPRAETMPALAEFGSSDPIGLALAGLPDSDVTGAEVVRALAAGFGQVPPPPPVVRPTMMAQPAEAMERPPIIIERAIAEQELGRIAVPAALPRPSPFPAFAVGFALSLLAGAALYAAM